MTDTLLDAAALLEWLGQLEAKLIERDDLACKVIALEAIIAKYASHDGDCDSALNAGECTCGFDAALGYRESSDVE